MAHKVPLILRQLGAVRSVLSATALLLFVLTSVVIFARPDITSTDLSFILPIPFLASLGVLPVGAPAFLIFLEILGTARILVAVHPHSSFRLSPSLSGNSNVGGTSASGDLEKDENSALKDRLPLLARYILATTLSRLWLKERFFHFTFLRGEPEAQTGIKIIRVPPASVYLLEKLGVATAFTLVDDELACEPHALPQQLLIPSGKGLKLLDICPTIEDDSGADESTVSGSERRKDRSCDVNDRDSGTDSDTPSPVDISSTREKAKHQFRLPRRRRSNKVGADPMECGLSLDQEVQFEDPNWWQHLPALKVRKSYLVFHFIREYVR